MEEKKNKEIGSEEQRKGKRILLCLVFVPFLIFHIQQLKPLVKLRPLKGDFVPVQKPEATLSSVFSGEYQENTNAYLNENFGFRNFFVRLNNQLRFSLFKKAQAKEVIVGKENYLYVQGYINGYFGFDYIGEKPINDTIAEIKRLQDTLKSLGKTLLVVIAPGKARIYPEYIPTQFSRTKPYPTNYSSFVTRFKNAGVNYLDFNQIFLNKRANSPQLLIPQLGVHWSRLEAVRAADTLLDYLSLISETALPGIHITKSQVKDELEEPDRDVVDGMNLLFYPRYSKMAYPEFEYVRSENRVHNALVISDSFWWDIYLRRIPRNCFRNDEFWYYCRDVWGSNHLGKKDISKVDVKRRLLQSKFVILICAESNLERLGFGFPGAALKALQRTIEPTQEELNAIKTYISNDEKWHEQIKTKAMQRNLSVDSMTTLDAHWTFQHSGPLLKKIGLVDVKEFIRSNADWMNDIKRKAAERNISIDSMITNDALWHMETELQEHTDPNFRLKQMIKLIQENKEWMEQIKTKAEDRKISVDSMIILDALWMIKQDSK